MKRLFENGQMTNKVSMGSTVYNFNNLKATLYQLFENFVDIENVKKEIRDISDKLHDSYINCCDPETLVLTIVKQRDGTEVEKLNMNKDTVILPERVSDFETLLKEEIYFIMVDGFIANQNQGVDLVYQRFEKGKRRTTTEINGELLLHYEVLNKVNRDTKEKYKEEGLTIPTKDYFLKDEETNKVLPFLVKGS